MRITESFTGLLVMSDCGDTRSLQVRSSRHPQLLLCAPLGRSNHPTGSGRGSFLLLVCFWVYALSGVYGF